MLYKKHFHKYVDNNKNVSHGRKQGSGFVSCSHIDFRLFNIKFPKYTESKIVLSWFNHWQKIAGWWIRVENRLTRWKGLSDKKWKVTRIIQVLMNAPPSSNLWKTPNIYKSLFSDINIKKTNILVIQEQAITAKWF